MAHVIYSKHLPKSLNTLTERLLRPAGRRRGFAEGRLLADWPLIVGEELASHAIPQKIARRGNHPGSLHIITEPAWALELQYMEPVILERIATFFGYRLIARLVIHQAPVPQPKPPAPLAPSPDPLPDSPLFTSHEDGPLKDTLRRLGAAIHSRSAACNPAKDTQYEDV